MYKNYLGAISLATVMGAATTAQAADMPKTTADYIQDVADACFNGQSPYDLKEQGLTDKWATQNCVLAVANSNRDVAYTYIDELETAATEETLYAASFVEAACPSLSIEPWLNSALEIQHDCIDALDAARISGLDANSAQRDLMYLAPMAHTGFGTAQFVAEKTIKEYLQLQMN
jgi:hypothetical protein